MESSEAMAVLTRAGQGEEAREIVNRASASAQARYREIEDDDTRTPEYQHDEVQRVYERTRSDVNEKLNKLAETAAQAENRDAVRIFGTADLSGDAATLAISRRDASDRVSAIQSRDELRDLLARANRSGDEVLARAVAEKALDNQDMDTLNAFLADRPRLNDAAQRLWDSVTAQAQPFENVLLLSALRPASVGAR